MKIYESFNENSILKSLGPYKERNADKSFKGINEPQSIEIHGKNNVYGNIEVHGKLTFE